MLGQLTLLAAAEESGGGMSIILPATAELVWGAISFAIVYFLVAKFAFPRMSAALEERAANIQGKLEEAEVAINEAESTKQRYEEQLREARGEANRIVEDGRQQGEALRRDIVTRAEQEAQAIIERARGEIATERERTVSALRSEVGTLSVRLAGKIVEKELDQQAHDALIDRYIQELSGSN